MRKKGFSNTKGVSSIQSRSSSCSHDKCYATSREEKDQELSLAPTAESSISITSLSPTMATKSFSSLRRSSSSQEAGLRLYNQALEKMKRLECERREQEEKSVKKGYSLNKNSSKSSSSSIRAGLRLHNLAAEKQKKLDALRKKLQDEEATMRKTVWTPRGTKETRTMQNKPTRKPRYQELHELGKEKVQHHRSFHVVIHDETNKGSCNQGTASSLKSWWSPPIYTNHLMVEASNSLKHDDTWDTCFKCF